MPTVARVKSPLLRLLELSDQEIIFLVRIMTKCSIADAAVVFCLMRPEIDLMIALEVMNKLNNPRLT